MSRAGNCSDNTVTESVATVKVERSCSAAQLWPRGKARAPPFEYLVEVFDDGSRRIRRSASVRDSAQ